MGGGKKGNGKGNGKGKWDEGLANTGGYGLGEGPPPNLPQLETQLTTLANQVYDVILNLNVSTPDVRGAVEETLSLRDRVLSLYGVATSGVTAPTALSTTQGGAEAAQDAKSKLYQVLAKKAIGRSLTKTDIVFTVQDQGNKTFVAAVSSEFLADTYHGEPSASKKAAEHSAAMAALLAEYPGEAPGAPAPAPAQPQPAQPRGRGQKREREEPPADPRSQLNTWMQLLLGRSTTKTDTNYETVELEAGKYMTKLTFPEYTGETVFESDVLGTKKDAERDAATKAMEAFRPDYEVKHAEHLEKKKEKSRKTLEALRAKQEAKKEDAGVNAIPIPGAGGEAGLGV